MRIEPATHQTVARLNVSIPTDLAPLVSKWRRKINLSEICTQALRSELTAVESHRSATALLARIRRTPSDLEQRLARRYGLAEVRVAATESADDRGIREALGAEAAEYLSRNLSAGAVLALAGGRQSWCIVQHLDPRPLAVSLVALGYRQNDPHLLTAHANTLTTLLWLLFSPQAEAHLVGGDPEKLLDSSAPVAGQPKYFVVASCAPFSAASPLARLLGAEATQALVTGGAACDFAYNFFDKRGRLVDVPLPDDQSVLSAPTLASISERPDARVVMVAAGREKRRAIQFALQAKLCNTLITDEATARALLSKERVGHGLSRGGRRPDDDAV
jgi:DNA-binding transcriptional regulator LsrR (DeoR family)